MIKWISKLGYSVGKIMDEDELKYTVIVLNSNVDPYQTWIYKEIALKASQMDRLLYG